ncbi:MAG: protein kinase [Deltaproteobacteria bacterium]|nr:protein kinase [Deltaproteobacteria bacterium]
MTNRSHDPISGARSDAGAPTVPEMEAVCPAVDGRYELERVLDRGSFGLVYVGRDVWLERPVCVKMIAPEHVAEALALRRFRREAVAHASVRSEHVAQVYSFGPHEDGYYLAMEHVQGRNLQDLIDEHTRHGARLPLLRAVSILRQICEGAAAIHRAGVVHRDIKPRNVVVEEATGRPVLIDFGLALKPAEKKALSGPLQVVGTPEYMAPELVDGSTFGPISAATDVYALACTAFELLVGHTPFEDPNPYKLLKRHLTELPAAPSSFLRELAPFDAVLSRALAKHPHHRFGSAAELGQALARAAEQARPPLPPSEDPLDMPSGVHRIQVPDLPTDVVPRPAVSRRVLVVDDDPEFRSFATRAAQIAFYGHDVRTKAVKTGSHALRDVAEKAPDLIVLDYDMPGLDGIDTLARIRDHAHGMAARVVIVSGKIGTGRRHELDLLGVDTVVAKPVEMPMLVDALANVAARAGWLRAVSEQDG